MQTLFLHTALDANFKLMVIRYVMQACVTTPWCFLGLQMEIASRYGGNCKYTEYAVTDRQQGAVLQPGG